jgi:hypothetical protein
LRRRHHLAQCCKTQLPKNEEEKNDEEEEHVKDKSPTSKSTSPTKQVWKEKGSLSSSPS